AGKVNIPEDCPAFDRKQLRFMPANAQMAVAAAYEAITEAGYTMETLPGDRMAVINGCAGSAYGEVCGSVANYEKLRNLRRVSAFSVPRVMPYPRFPVFPLYMVYRAKIMTSAVPVPAEPWRSSPDPV
ncbi:MAG: hypothetical protein IKB22_04445, partial [Lentisphaeria bacterium]|nr:hypothetical protein [Lentisphaeria bacterium]